MEDSLLATIVLPLALATIMFSLGLSLTAADFRRVFVEPTGVGIGIFNLGLISPLLALGVAELFSLDPVLAVGLVLMGAAPGGTMANLLTDLARGDTALSISMTAISSLAAVVTVPLFLRLATDHFEASGLDGDIEMLGIVARVLLITILPLLAGMTLRARAPGWVVEVQPAFKRAALGVWFAVLVGVVIAEGATIAADLDRVLPAVVVLNVGAMTIAFLMARFARLSDRQSTAIAIELGVHNSTLALAIGASISSELAVPAAVYAAFMWVSGGLFARVMHQRNADPGGGPGPAVPEAP